MPTTLYNSPADVVRQALVDLGLGTDPEQGSAWPVSRSEPDEPDATIAVYNTSARPDGRNAIDGVQTLHYGIMVRFRAGDQRSGWRKANAVYDALCRLHRRWVTVEGHVYVLEAFSPTGGLNDVGQDTPGARRWIITLNGLVSVTQLT